MTHSTLFFYKINPAGKSKIPANISRWCSLKNDMVQPPLRFLIPLLFSCLWLARLSAQPVRMEFVYVDEVTIEGNKKTRGSIIRRELLFQPGDTLLLSELGEILERSEQLVLNTGLFNAAQIVFKNWEGSTNRVHLHVKVEENWYLYPVPVFELADRNFNVWWVEQNRSLSRVNYGVEFTHLNLTGRRDKLNLRLNFGYTRNYRIRYSLPYFNAKQTLGFFSEVSYSQNKEVNYITRENKQEFYRREDRFVYERFHTNAGLSIRPGFRTNHAFILGFQQNRIDETVATELNPDYFLDQRQLQRFFSLIYQYSFENRDVRFYPWSGNFFAFTLEKDGLGVFSDRNALTVFSRYDQHFPFGKRWSLALGLRGKLSLIREQQPYNDNRAMGFLGNTPHGFEYYIIDGLDMVFFQSSLHFALFGAQVNFGKLMPIKAFRKMPIKLYLSLNNDAGYVNDPFAADDNFLSNTPLWGGGFGLDVVLFYDKVLRLEYSVNHLKEGGLFLHFNLNI